MYPMFSFQMENPAESILDSLLQLTDFDPACEFCFQSIILVLEPLDLGTTYNEKGMNIKGQRNEEEKDNNLLFLVLVQENVDRDFDKVLK